MEVDKAAPLEVLSSTRGFHFLQSQSISLDPKVLALVLALGERQIH